MKDIINAVENNKQLILDAERYIWKNPETGYKEVKTSKYMEEQFEKLGYELIKPDNITGFVTVIDTGREGPELLILGELDSIICPAHKDADPVTGAVHACGHNAQCASLLGVAAALKDQKILDKLSGRIRLCAVPAEELLEIEYRNELKKKGVIKYFGGKSEFLYRGLFDGVDLAFMVHTSTDYSVMLGSNGCVAKNIIYKGLASHAGGHPQGGINALYAANCGINAINAIRETFYDNDHVRVHPIVTSGGDMVNAIPETVTLESYVRGATYDVIVKENQKVNRALIGGALSIGANIEIIDIPGYSPLYNDANMNKVAEEAAKLAVPQYQFTFENRISYGSTDMGDLSGFMPVVHPYCGGAKGKSHGNDYEICDPIAACVDNAKFQLAMILILLGNKAERAKQIVKDFKGCFASKEEFLAYQDSLNCSGNRIEYKENGSCEINLK